MSLVMSDPSVQQFFPCIPDNMDWEAWNGNFIIYYGQENVAYNSEDNWQNTAQSIAQSPTFSAYPVPDPGLFDDWRNWAKEVTLIINGPSH